MVSSNATSNDRRLAFATFMVACVVALAGCSSPPATPADDFGQKVDEAIALATRAHASQSQLDALATAKREGSLSLELARQQTNAAIECMTEAGVNAHYDERSKPGGLTVPIYLAEIRPDSPVDEGGVSQDERVTEQCDSKEAFYVNKLFLTQPASVEAKQHEIEKRAPEIRACLEDAGYPPAGDATPSDLDSQALDVYNQTEGKVDCVIGLGL